MKHIIKFPIIIAFAFLMVIAMDGQAQQKYTLTGEPKLIVSGTSSLHDWNMVSKQAKGSAILNITDAKITAIEFAEFSMEVKSLKSGRGQMDNNAYKALEAGDHPSIAFNLKHASLSGNKWKVAGDLQIAGSTRTENFDVVTRMEGNKVVLSANTAFKLTDFDVDPPSAVFGTIKTGDEVTLTIEMNLNPIN